jgi:hypothetical protein
MAKEYKLILSESCKLNTEMIAAALNELIPLGTRKVDIYVQEVHSEFNHQCNSTTIER